MRRLYTDTELNDKKAAKGAGGTFNTFRLRKYLGLNGNKKKQKSPNVSNVGAGGPPYQSQFRLGSLSPATGRPVAAVPVYLSGNRYNPEPWMYTTVTSKTVHHVLMPASRVFPRRPVVYPWESYVQDSEEKPEEEPPSTDTRCGCATVSRRALTWSKRQQPRCTCMSGGTFRFRPNARNRAPVIVYPTATAEIENGKDPARTTTGRPQDPKGGKFCSLSSAPFSKNTPKRKSILECEINPYDLITNYSSHPTLSEEMAETERKEETDKEPAKSLASLSTKLDQAVEDEWEDYSDHQDVRICGQRIRIVSNVTSPFTVLNGNPSSDGTSQDLVSSSTGQSRLCKATTTIPVETRWNGSSEQQSPNNGTANGNDRSISHRITSDYQVTPSSIKSPSNRIINKNSFVGNISSKPLPTHNGVATKSGRQETEPGITKSGSSVVIKIESPNSASDQSVERLSRQRPRHRIAQEVLYEENEEDDDEEVEEEDIPSDFPKETHLGVIHLGSLCHSQSTPNIAAANLYDRSDLSVCSSDISVKPILKKPVQDTSSETDSDMYAPATELKRKKKHVHFKSSSESNLLDFSEVVVVIDNNTSQENCSTLKDTENTSTTISPEQTVNNSSEPDYVNQRQILPQVEPDYDDCEPVKPEVPKVLSMAPKRPTVPPPPVPIRNTETKISFSSPSQTNQELTNVNNEGNGKRNIQIRRVNSERQMPLCSRENSQNIPREIGKPRSVPSRSNSFQVTLSDRSSSMDPRMDNNPYNRNEAEQRTSNGPVTKGKWQQNFPETSDDKWALNGTVPGRRSLVHQEASRQLDWLLREKGSNSILPKSIKDSLRPEDGIRDIAIEFDDFSDSVQRKSENTENGTRHQSEDGWEDPRSETPFTALPKRFGNSLRSGIEQHSNNTFQTNQRFSKNTENAMEFISNLRNNRFSIPRPPLIRDKNTISLRKSLPPIPSKTEESSDDDCSSVSIYEQINEPIYEELPDFPEDLPEKAALALAVPNGGGVQPRKSIFEGASRHEILSILEDARERGLENLEVAPVLVDGDDLDTQVVPAQRNHRIRVSNISNFSDSSHSSVESTHTEDGKTSKERRGSVEVERNDSGVGPETSKPSRLRRQTTVSNGNEESLCEDCDQTIETPRTDSDVALFDPLVCKKCSKKRTERREIITEIVETEMKYGRDLRIMKEEFYRPMAIAGLLTHDQLNSIFLNVDELLEVNSKFTEKLRDALDIAAEQGDDDYMTVNIGGLFLDSSSMLHAFETYCVRQGPASMLLTNLEKEKELLRIFLRVSQMENTLLRRMNLNSFLMVPVQRVTKYPLLLNRLCKVTPYHHKDRESIKKAQQKIELHLEHINQQAKDISGTKIWRRISHISAQYNKKFPTEQEIGNIKLRKMALEVLEWNSDEIRFVLEGKLLYTQVIDHLWNRKNRTLKLTSVQALLVTLGKPNANYCPELADTDRLLFPKDTGIKEATLLIAKEKNNRLALVRDPLCLQRCIVCSDSEVEDMFEVQEFTTKETFLFKADDAKETQDWLKQLCYHAKDLGSWRRRRNALANIMINGMARN